MIESVRTFLVLVVIFFLVALSSQAATSLKDNLNVMNKESVQPLTSEQKQRLLSIARGTIEAYIRRGETLDFKETDPRLTVQEGAFVTLHKRDNLRGCMGRIIAFGEPLYKTVRDMAIVAATRDPRFDPLSVEELKEVDVEVSVLSIPWEIKDVNKITLGVHGVIVSQGGKSGVFLPQVADTTGWSKEEFLSQLCYQKAGLAPDAWKDPKTKIQIFTADVFAEHEFAQ